MKTLVAYWILLASLCVPAFSETSIPARDRMPVAGALNHVALIPVAANSPGRFGAHYKTRVVIFNPTSRDYSITARLFGRNGPAGSSATIPINPGQYLAWENFLQEVLDFSGSGAVIFSSPDEQDEFYLTAEVYTDSPNGRFSTTVVNGIIPTFVSSTEPDFNVGITVNDSRRTNIGVWNWETKPSSIEAKVFDASGMLVQTIGFELKGLTWQQKTISVPVDNGNVRWEINGESEIHYFYAVEVDNASNDGTLNWSVKGSTASAGGGGGGNGETANCAAGSVIRPGGECNLTVGGSSAGTFSVDSNSRGCIRIGGITLCSGTSHNYRGTRLNQYTVTFVAHKRDDGSWEITMYSITG